MSTEVQVYSNSHSYSNGFIQKMLKNSNFTNAANQVLQSTLALFHCHGTHPSFINYSEYSSLNSPAWLVQ